MRNAINFLASFDADDIQFAAASLAHELWTAGHLSPVPHDCQYADSGDSDADYENACPVCRDYLIELAKSVIESDWLIEQLEASVADAVELEQQKLVTPTPLTGKEHQ